MGNNIMVNHWADDVKRHLENYQHTLPDETWESLNRLCEIVEDSADYRYRNPIFLNLESAMTEVEDLDSLSEIMLAAAQASGFDHASIILLKSGDASHFTKRVCTSFPRAWLLKYDQEKYQYIDPVIAKAITSSEPFIFSDLPELAPFGASFWTDAVDFEIGREGCCFTYNFEKNIKIAISFTSMGNSKEVTKYFIKNRSDLEQFGLFACQIFIEQAGTMQADFSRLTLNELHFMKELTSSQSDAMAIALLRSQDKLHILDSIFRKMGVNNIFQAISLVSRQLWFDELPFEGTEIAKPYAGPLERSSNQAS